MHAALDRVLIEQLSAHDAIDLPPQRGDAVFVIELLMGLAREEILQSLIAPDHPGRDRASKRQKQGRNNGEAQQEREIGRAHV